jgi:hypothetical protein
MSSSHFKATFPTYSTNLSVEWEHSFDAFHFFFITKELKDSSKLDCV